MTDVFSAEKRSQVMSRIQGKETKLEIKVRQFLRRQGIGFRKNYAHLPGKPDVVLTKYKSVIFINGCFWHGHCACNKGRCRPKTRRRYWTDRILRNQRRDRRVARRLRIMGFHVYTVWECEIKCVGVPTRLLNALTRPRVHRADSMRP